MPKYVLADRLRSIGRAGSLRSHPTPTAKGLDSTVMVAPFVLGQFDELVYDDNLLVKGRLVFD